jgi:hypothetical protein
MVTQELYFDFNHFIKGEISKPTEYYIIVINFKSFFMNKILPIIDYRKETI